MKNVVFAAAIVAVSTGAALAGSLETPADVTVMAPAAEAGTDWTGPYLGAFYGAASGEMYDIGGPYVLNNDASFFGGFIGYRKDFGNIVVGAEVSTTLGMDMYQAAFPTWEFTGLTDLRATVGYDFGRVLVYASGGYTTSGFQVLPSQFTYDGWNAGVGADFLVTDKIFIGGEYVYRSLSRTTDRSWTGEFGTLQGRIGVQF